MQAVGDLFTPVNGSSSPICGDQEELLGDVGIEHKQQRYRCGGSSKTKAPKRASLAAVRGTVGKLSSAMNLQGQACSDLLQFRQMAFNVDMARKVIKGKPGWNVVTTGPMEFAVRPGNIFGVGSLGEEWLELSAARDKPYSLASWLNNDTSGDAIGLRHALIVAQGDGRLHTEHQEPLSCRSTPQGHKVKTMRSKQRCGPSSTKKKRNRTEERNVESPESEPERIPKSNEQIKKNRKVAPKNHEAVDVASFATSKKSSRSRSSSGRGRRASNKSTNSAKLFNFVWEILSAECGWGFQRGHGLVSWEYHPPISAQARGTKKCYSEEEVLDFATHQRPDLIERFHQQQNRSIEAKRRLDEEKQAAQAAAQKRKAAEEARAKEERRKRKEEIKNIRLVAQFERKERERKAERFKSEASKRRRSRGDGDGDHQLANFAWAYLKENEGWQHRPGTNLASYAYRAPTSDTEASAKWYNGEEELAAFVKQHRADLVQLFEKRNESTQAPTGICANGAKGHSSSTENEAGEQSTCCVHSGEAKDEDDRNEKKEDLKAAKQHSRGRSMKRRSVYGAIDAAGSRSRSRSRSRHSSLPPGDGLSDEKLVLFAWDVLKGEEGWYHKKGHNLADFSYHPPKDSGLAFCNGDDELVRYVKHDRPDITSRFKASVEKQEQELALQNSKEIAKAREEALNRIRKSQERQERLKKERLAKIAAEEEKERIRLAEQQRRTEEAEERERRKQQAIAHEEEKRKQRIEADRRRKKREQEERANRRAKDLELRAEKKLLAQRKRQRLLSRNGEHGDKHGKKQRKESGESPVTAVVATPTRRMPRHDERDTPERALNTRRGVCYQLIKRLYTWKPTPIKLLVAADYRNYTYLAPHAMALETDEFRYGRNVFADQGDAVLHFLTKTGMKLETLEEASAEVSPKRFLRLLERARNTAVNLRDKDFDVLLRTVELMVESKTSNVPEKDEEEDEGDESSLGELEEDEYQTPSIRDGTDASLGASPKSTTHISTARSFRSSSALSPSESESDLDAELKSQLLLDGWTWRYNSGLGLSSRIYFNKRGRQYKQSKNKSQLAKPEAFLLSEYDSFDAVVEAAKRRKYKNLQSPPLAFEQRYSQPDARNAPRASSTRLASNVPSPTTPSLHQRRSAVLASRSTPSPQAPIVSPVASRWQDLVAAGWRKVTSSAGKLLFVSPELGTEKEREMRRSYGGELRVNHITVFDCLTDALMTVSSKQESTGAERDAKTPSDEFDDRREGQGNSKIEATTATAVNGDATKQQKRAQLGLCNQQASPNESIQSGNTVGDNSYCHVDSDDDHDMGVFYPAAEDAAKPVLYPSDSLLTGDPFLLDEYYAALEDFAVAKLSKEWIGREDEVDELVSYLSNSTSVSRNVLVHGDTGTGKSGLVRHVLDALGAEYAWVNCDLCTTLQALFKTLHRGLPKRKDEDSDDVDDLDNIGEDDEDHDEEIENEYEQSRNRNLAENAAVLTELGLIDIEPSKHGEDGAKGGSDKRMRDQHLSKYGNRRQASSRQKRVKCDRSHEFTQLLATTLSESGDRFKSGDGDSTGKRCFNIVLDNADTLHSRFPLLLKYFVRLSTQMQINLRIILISGPVTTSLANILQTSRVLSVPFKPYTLMESQTILTCAIKKSVERRLSAAAVRKTTLGLDWGGCSLKRFCEPLARYITSVCFRDIRNISELIHIAEDFVSFLSRQAKQAQLGSVVELDLKQTLDLRAKITLKRLFQRNWQSEPDENMACQEQDERNALLDAAENLPYNSKVLLIAAFLASFNKPEHDRQLFGSHSRKTARQKIHKGFKRGGGVSKAGAKDRSMPQWLLGPRKFNVERVLWLYKALLTSLHDSHTAHEGFQEGMYKHLGRLVSMGMLTRVSPPEELSKIVFKCCAPTEYVFAVASTIKDLTLADFLEEPPANSMY